MRSTIEELHAFMTIVDTGSFIAAAEKLGQTASGLSRSLSRLESKLEVTLLERTTRKLKLTQEGQQFLNHARKILSDLNAAEEALQKSDQDTAGVIRVDSATPFILHVITPLVHKFRRCYPNIEIELNSNDLVIDLLEQKTDVAFRFGELNDSSLHAKLVCKSRIYIVASPEYLSRKGMPQQPKQLYEHDVVGFTRPTYINKWPIKVDGEYFFAQAKVKASSGETVRQLCLRGQGIARLSEFEVWQDINEGRLIALFEDQIEYSYQSIHAVYYQQEHLPKRVRLFIEFLSEQLAHGFSVCQ